MHAYRYNSYILLYSYSYWPAHLPYLTVSGVRSGHSSGNRCATQPSSISWMTSHTSTRTAKNPTMANPSTTGPVIVPSAPNIFTYVSETVGHTRHTPASTRVGCIAGRSRIRGHGWTGWATVAVHCGVDRADVRERFERLRDVRSGTGNIHGGGTDRCGWARSRCWWATGPGESVKLVALLLQLLLLLLLLRKMHRCIGCTAVVRSDYIGIPITILYFNLKVYAIIVLFAK